MENQSFKKYRDAAELIYPGLGGWTFDKFLELNERFFFGKVPVMPIQWHLTLPYGKAIGRAFLTGIIQIGMYTSKKWCLRDSKPCLFGEHVLLHEMLHQYLWTIGKTAGHDHEPWCTEIMRIGVELGMKPFTAEVSKVRKVRDGAGNRKSKRQRGGDLSGEQIATFPHYAFDYEKDLLLSDYT